MIYKVVEAGPLLEQYLNALYEIGWRVITAGGDFVILQREYLENAVEVSARNPALESGVDY
jgi:hypothetical protein